MAYTETELAEELKSKKYEFGFVSNFESDKAPKGLNEDIIRLISAKKKRTSMDVGLSTQRISNLEGNG